MEIHAYIKQKKEFHKALIDHLDSDDDTNFKYDEILTKKSHKFSFIFRQQCKKI